MNRSLNDSSRRANNSSRSRPEGIDEYFDPPLESKYECPICLFGLREPVQTECGHRFCKVCITRSLKDAGYKCPVDNLHLTEADLYPDNFAKREINSLTVWCRLNKERGCPWKGFLKDLEDHMKNCPFSDVECPNSCGVKVQPNELEKHMDENCPKRKTQCAFCKLDIYSVEAENHAAECLKMPVNCEKCQKREILREQMAQHLESDCPKVIRKCPVSFFGCRFEGYSPDVSQHIAENLVQHFKDISKAIRQQEERPVISPVARSAGPSTSNEESATPVRTQPSMPMRSDDNAQSLPEEVKKLKDRVIDLEGRVSAGTFIWKIENFRHCPSQAISPPFYTGLYGYKMCLKMNRTGVDSGRGHHLSLFVHMMQGDWDDILEWPFTGRITLAILDQSDNVEFRRPISETLVTKPNLLAFQKPTTSRNHKGYGYEEFCQINQLHDGQFIKNNSMLVRIQVFH